MTTAKSAPALKFLATLRQHTAAIRKDTPKLVALAERMAAPLLAGGDLFPAGVAPWWPTEFSGRAGGFMGIKWCGYEARSAKDVAIFPLPGARDWDPRKDEALQKLMKGKAQLFVIGRKEQLAPLGNLNRFAGFTGGVMPDEGSYATGDFRPLCPLRPFEQIVRAWVTTGELVGACTRGGKMPILWMSVWLEGSFARNASFVEHNNVLEPWFTPLFHKGRYIPPLVPGYTVNAFLTEVEGIIAVLEKQHAALAKAGRWMAEAKKKGKRVYTILVGHSYPEILERPNVTRSSGSSSKDSQYPIEWGHSVSDITKAVPADYGAGDVVVHLGYSPVNVDHVQGIVKRGIRFVYTTPYGRPESLKDQPNLIWLDSPWRPTDQSIDVPGYGVRMLPMSSSAGSAVYFSLLSEMAERMGWK